MQHLRTRLAKANGFRTLVARGFPVPQDFLEYVHQFNGLMRPRMSLNFLFARYGCGPCVNLFKKLQESSRNSLTRVQRYKGSNLGFSQHRGCFPLIVH